MSLFSELITNRFIYSSRMGDAQRAQLITHGIAAMLAATIGKKFFRLDPSLQCAGMIGGSALIFTGLTNRDGPLQMFKAAATVGIAFFALQALKEKRVNFNLFNVDPLTLGLGTLLGVHALHNSNRSQNGEEMEGLGRPRYHEQRHS